ncbi:MAG: P-loop NTPase [Maricaulaceae bacterium]
MRINPIPPNDAEIVAQARAALQAIPDPEGGDIVSSGRVSGLVSRKRMVAFALSAPPDQAAQFETLRAQAEAAVQAIRGVKSVRAVLTAHGAAPAESASEPAPAPGAVRLRKGARLSAQAQAQAAPKPAPGATQLSLPGVKAVIAVASGKGGVGKSTVAANLACAFAQLGRKTGLLDADVYGPSLPRLLNLGEADPERTDAGQLIPPEAFGLKTMSMGFLVDEDAPMVWRGPVVSGAITQMLKDVAWGELDVLLLDLPPGTGDAQLTLAQRAPLTGAVIVSTPQEVALADVRRGVEMFRKTHVPILGVVENMSGFIHPSTGERIDIFGAGGARRTTDAFAAPFLGEIPLDPDLRARSDAGSPPAADPEHGLYSLFRDFALKIEAEAARARKPAPEIVWED